MKLYTCNNCDNPLFFENDICLICNNIVGFDAEGLKMVTLVRGQGNIVINIKNNQQSYKFCANASHGTCNWLIPLQDESLFCRACILNRTIPTLSSQQNTDRWVRIEVAKHRLVYSLLRLQLPVTRKEGEETNGIAFDFLADVSPAERVVTGHNNGTITLNIEEADEAERVRHKLDLGERYRTLLGHFRHEIGHYYWNVLIQNDPAIEKFRALFGDERADYPTALNNYYNTGAPANWVDYYISPYATAHPWEDWAESWAHYLHLMDTLETAYYFGMGIHPKKIKSDLSEMKADINQDPYTINDFEDILQFWLPLTFALNSLNRSMGHPDFYPFIISPAVKEKLRFIHDTCRKVVSS